MSYTSQKINIIFVGLGGIGSNLCEPICRFINYLPDRDRYEIVMVDGDHYENKNLSRQYFNSIDVGLNKAETQMNLMKEKFRDLNISAVNEYLTEDNITTTIPEKSIILSGVDNHKTRKLIQDHCNDLQNVLYISGGNFYIDGDILIFANCNGRQLAPTIYQNHADIANPVDKMPHEISCEELVESEPQLLFTNGTVSICMQWAFYNYYKMFDDENIEITKNEIIFDIVEMRVISHNRPIK